MSSLLRPTSIGLAWLGLFALVYTWGDEVGAWPKAPLGGLRDLDLVLGFLAAIAVLVTLLAPNRTLKADG